MSEEQLFQIWEPQPQEDVALLRTAVELFAKGDKVSYVEVLSNSQMRDALSKAGRELAGGPMLGDVSSSTISVWVRTIKPSKVSVVAKPLKGKKTVRGEARSDMKTDLTAVVKLKGLSAETDYTYQVLIDGKELKLADLDLRFRTPVKEHSSKIEGRIIFGSCFHRWGLSNVKQTELIIKHRPDALVFNGDISVQDRYCSVAGHNTDNFLRDMYPTWRKMIAQLPVYATWDDHDYMRNDYGGIGNIKEPKTSAEGRDAITEVWRNSWVNPYYGNGKEGIYTSTTVGVADIIMVDNRYFRTEKSRGGLLGIEQLEWLKKTLIESKSPFKILSCGTMWSDVVSKGKDSWGAYDPQGRDDLFKMIYDNNIKGVLLISGDRHGARIFTVPVNDEFSLYEFGGASLGGRWGPPATSSQWTTQLYGMSNKFAFSEFTFGGTKSNPTLEFKLIGEQEDILFSRSISYDELTPKK